MVGDTVWFGFCHSIVRFVRLNKPNCAILIPVHFPFDKKASPSIRLWWIEFVIAVIETRKKKKILQTTTCQCNYICIWYFRQRFFFCTFKRRNWKIKQTHTHTHSYYFNNLLVCKVWFALYRFWKRWATKQTKTIEYSPITRNNLAHVIIVTNNLWWQFVKTNDFNKQTTGNHEL